MYSCVINVEGVTITLQKTLITVPLLKMRISLHISYSLLRYSVDFEPLFSASKGSSGVNLDDGQPLTFPLLPHWKDFIAADVFQFPLTSAYKRYSCLKLLGLQRWNSPPV